MDHRIGRPVGKVCRESAQFQQFRQQQSAFQFLSQDVGFSEADQAGAKFDRLDLSGFLQALNSRDGTFPSVGQGAAIEEQVSEGLLFWGHRY